MREQHTAMEMLSSYRSLSSSLLLVLLLFPLSPSLSLAELSSPFSCLTPQGYGNSSRLFLSSLASLSCKEIWVVEVFFIVDLQRAIKREGTQPITMALRRSRRYQACCRGNPKEAEEALIPTLRRKMLPCNGFI